MVKKQFLFAYLTLSSLSCIHASETEQRCLVYDYDDTICSTNELHKVKAMDHEALFSDYIHRNYDELFKLDTTMFETILNIQGNVDQSFLITNAAMGWLQDSSDRLHPKTNTYFRFLERITHSDVVISARDYVNKRARRFKSVLNDHTLWKYPVFHSTLRSCSEVIVIGDGPAEHRALKLLAQNAEKEGRSVLQKHVWFKQKPTIQDLILQWDALGKMWRYLRMEKAPLNLIWSDDTQTFLYQKPDEDFDMSSIEGF